MKESFREAIGEFAQRLIQNGVLDSEVHRYVHFSLKEIRKFTNGNIGTE